MHVKRLLCTVSLGLFTALTPLSAAAFPGEGALIKSADDPKVYLVENGRRRWIDSGETFQFQGLSASLIQTIPANELAQLPDGEPVTKTSTIILPSDTAVLADLSPFAMQNVHLAKEGGRTVLRFTSTFWNMGKGPFELNADPHGGVTTNDVYEDTFEHIVRPDGSVRNKIVGNFLWHEEHHHYHYGDFADYVLEQIVPTVTTTSARVLGLATTVKTTFCMRDDKAIASATRAKYGNCTLVRQGVSVGWADIYPSSLPDQFIDVTDLPAGKYRLSFVVDPRHHFVEGNVGNNTSVVILDLDPAAYTVKILASGSPFVTAENKYPEGMLLRSETNPEVYVIHLGRKRLLRTAGVFESYGYDWNAVYTVPQAVLDAIPRETLVRPAGSGSIYVLNAAGYRRRILNPDVMKSYGWAPTNIVEISPTEFASYPDTDLIRRSGSDRVYAIGTRTFVGMFKDLAGLGLDPASVHVVNDTDFSAYAVQIVARDLNIPWDIVFLPDGDMLVTERSGTLRRIGKHPATIALPSVLQTGEGGLMGMALHPDFVSNNLIYMYFTTVAGGQTNQVMRFRLEGDRLVEDKVIVDHIPSALYHDGGALTFGPDGMLYLTTGDAETPALAQDLKSIAGKTLRFTPDGGIPSDNPFGTAVYSYGHRNAQGLAWDAWGHMWQTEHGRSGASSGLDELNLIEKGKNYGWPTIQGDEKQEGLVTPVLNSGPNVTWAPSGLAFTGGKLYFAGLRGSALYVVTPTENGGPANFQTLLKDVYGRLRAVVVGPDGSLYISTSNRDGRGTIRPQDDKIIRVYPDFF